MDQSDVKLHSVKKIYSICEEHQFIKCKYITSFGCSSISPGCKHDSSVLIRTSKLPFRCLLQVVDLLLKMQWNLWTMFEKMTTGSRTQRGCTSSTAFSSWCCPHIMFRMLPEDHWWQTDWVLLCPCEMFQITERGGHSWKYNHFTLQQQWSSSRIAATHKLKVELRHSLPRLNCPL